MLAFMTGVLTRLGACAILFANAARCYTWLGVIFIKFYIILLDCQNICSG